MKLPLLRVVPDMLIAAGGTWYRRRWGSRSGRGRRSGRGLVAASASVFRDYRSTLFSSESEMQARKRRRLNRARKQAPARMQAREGIAHIHVNVPEPSRRLRNAHLGPAPAGSAAGRDSIIAAKAATHQEDRRCDLDSTFHLCSTRNEAGSASSFPFTACAPRKTLPRETRDEALRDVLEQQAFEEAPEAEIADIPERICAWFSGDRQPGR